MTLNELNEATDLLYFYVCQYGINQVKPDTEDNDAMSEFRIAVHSGWKKAQEHVAITVSLLDKELQSIKVDIGHARKNKDSKKKMELTEKKFMLEHFRYTMLSGINSIIWTIFGQQHWIVRRLFLERNIDNSSTEALSKSLKVANEYNKEKRKLAICCDLTTFMHVGDLVIVDLSDETHSIKIAELKEGKVNEKCFETLQQFYKTQCPANLYFNTIEFTDKERSQLHRMMRQQWRMSNVHRAIEGKESYDIATENKLRIPDEKYIIQSWDDRVIKLFEKIESGKTWAIDVIADCLFVGLYSDKVIGKFAFEGWLEGIGFSGIRINYLTGLRVPLAKPPFCLLWPRDLILRVVKGDIWLMMALDIPKWIYEVNNIYPELLRLESKKKSKKVEYRKGDLIEYQHRLISCGNPSMQSYLGTGILAKVFYDFNSPIDLMRPMTENL